MTTTAASGDQDVSLHVPSIGASSLGRNITAKEIHAGLVQAQRSLLTRELLATLGWEAGRGSFNYLQVKANVLACSFS
jgi:hypothetical protein